ncbi:hypothetical protein DFP73DRAFT_296212 [Morchella snyderi]|nr:hypothetical protein DFP73DRAFT_296212 [Morchella snyderi]
MVLHKNKWDKKATRAHVRKLKSQGKEDDTKKSRGEKKEGEQPGTSVLNKQEFPKLPGTEEAELENKDSQDEEADEDEDGEGGQFSKRKMQNNAWRYEKEEEEPVPGEEPEEPESEPDYVTMTVQRKGQFNAPNKIPEEDLDLDFLKDLQLQGQRSRGAEGSEDFGGTKGKVVKVDRKQFEDVTTKIAKNSTVDAFRQRFAPRKTKSRVGGGGGGAWGGAPDDDVDSFLEELKVVEITATHPAGSREISSDLGKGRTNEGYEHDKDDDWLDGMLGGR